MSCLLCLLEIVPVPRDNVSYRQEDENLMKQKRHIAEAIIHVLQFEDLV